MKYKKIRVALTTFSSKENATNVVTQLIQKKLVACDLSSKLCENAKNKAPHADVRIADLEDLPFNDNSIDCGFATEVLEHMETPLKALKEIHRVLKPNSRLLISLPNKDWFRFDEYLGKREKFQPVDDKFYTVLEMEEFQNV